MYILAIRWLSYHTHTMDASQFEINARLWFRERAKKNNNNNNWTHLPHPISKSNEQKLFPLTAKISRKENKYKDNNKCPSLLFHNGIHMNWIDIEEKHDGNLSPTTPFPLLNSRYLRNIYAKHLYSILFIHILFGINLIIHTHTHTRPQSCRHCCCRSYTIPSSR